MFFDSRVLDPALSDIWLKPARGIKKVFVLFEEQVIDRRIIDGLGDAIATIGKSLRLVQNGQVQFYFALGLILMGAIIIRFVVAGG